MLKTTLILVAAIIMGRLLRGSSLPGIAARLVLPAVFLLLFVLGLGLGADARLMGDLPLLLGRALLLTFFALAGCLLLARPISRHFGGSGRR